MESLSKREIFNKVKAHLLLQGEKSFSEDGGCLYRGPDGNKCAVGCLIDDIHYSNVFEGENAECSYVVRALRYSGINDVVAPGVSRTEIMTMLLDLQDVHDGIEPESWAMELDRIEKIHFKVLEKA